MDRLLNRSVEDSLKLEMVYQAHNGLITQRTISVKSYNEIQLIAFCHYRNQNRLFRRDRILSLFPLHRQKVINDLYN
ncbi:hypothetical protein [Halalkalibacter alkalisediminis]|uniref:WYL domain-containing protein n=1 Tax=Halalkalibacter alkalisediminis TaxID=935616 RepID=A0ABV6NBL6_9BACI|nr:hypothetical protein [Halalkalibacter alkalisediminis]